MGFVFKPPQEVPNTQNTDGSWEIIEWLPDSSEEVLVEGPLSLEVINVISGTARVYATVNAPGAIDQPTWLPEAAGVAYLTSDGANQTNLWLGKANSKPEVLVADVGVPLIPIEKGQSLAVYHKNDQVMKVVSPNGKNIGVASQMVTTSLPQFPSDKMIKTAHQPSGDWIAYHNMDGFQLANSQSGERQSIDLKKFGGNELEPLWVTDAEWSPDGQKLALIVTQGRSLYPFTNLYILDWPAGTLRKIDDTFTYVTDIAWSPDSQHLLIGAVIGRDEYGVDITALYITNVSIPSEILPVPIPVDGLGINFGGGLTWSPDGKTVLVQYFDGQHVALYRIAVIAQ
jgi:Tol biopolymer transport system component